MIPSPMSSKNAPKSAAAARARILGTLAGWLMQSGRHPALRSRGPLRPHPPGAAVPPVIYALWHNRIFTIPPLVERICGTHRKAVVLTSASQDGAMLARAMAVFGLGSVRGSSSRRGGGRPDRHRNARSKEGLDVCITPDGPRGPRYVFQPGVIKLAESTGAPILPIHVRYSPPPGA